MVTYISRDRDSGRHLKFPKKYRKETWTAAGGGVYIRHGPFAKIAFLKVNLKFFPMKQSISRISYRFSYAVQIRCRKPHF